MSTTQQLPIIDLSRPEAENAPLIHAALKEFGFLYVSEHGVAAELQGQMADLARSYFALPEEEKMEMAMEKAGMAWRGYFPVKGELTSGVPDLKEGLYFGVEHGETHPEVKRGTPLHGRNQWPTKSAMREVVLGYMAAVKGVAEKLMRLVALGLGLEADYFARRYGDEPTELFRIFNYPSPNIPLDNASDQELLGVHEHTDMGFLTILLQDQHEGLEVKVRESGTWLEAPPLPGTFVVNIGDMLELWTHGIYQATLHRVRNKTREDRLSFPYFFDPSWHSHLQAIEKEDLRPEELAQVPPATVRKWDGTDLKAIQPETTYGEFVWNKVRNVFPEL